MTALVLTFGARAFSDTELRNTRLAAGNTIVISTEKTNKNVMVKFLKKHMAYVNFLFFFFSFSSLCSTVASKIYNFLQTKQTTHYVAVVMTKAVKISHTQSKHVK